MDRQYEQNSECQPKLKTFSKHFVSRVDQTDQPRINEFILSASHEPQFLIKFNENKRPEIADRNRIEEFIAYFQILNDKKN